MAVIKMNKVINKLYTPLVSFLIFQAVLLLGFKEKSLVFILSLSFLAFLVFKNVKVALADLKKLLTQNNYYCFFTIFLILRFFQIYIEYRSFEFSAFDTGIYANQLWNFIQNGSYYSDILNQPGLSNHFTPILILFAPLMKIWPSFLLLPIIKTIAWFISAILLLKITEHILGKDNQLKYIPAFLWLVHRYTNKLLDFEFQVSSLSLPIIFLVFYWILKNNFKLIFIPLILLLGFKENLALIWIVSGIYIFTYSQRRILGAWLVSLGMIFLYVFPHYVIPSFAHDIAYPHSIKLGPFAHLGLKIKLIFNALLSVAFLPLLVPKTFLFLLPAFATALLSNQKEMLNFSYHYQDIALPILFICFIYGLKVFQNYTFTYKNKFCAIIIIFMLGFHNYYPTRSILKFWPTNTKDQIYRELEQAKSIIPSHSTLCTLDSLGAYFYQYKVKIIKDLNFLQADKCQYVILSSELKLWPIENNFQQIKIKLAPFAIRGNELTQLALYKLTE